MRCRRFSLSHGMSIRTGQFGTQREHAVQSSLKRAFDSVPVPASHEPPIPPEYVSPPNAWPPTASKFAHEFRQALQRMQYSASCSTGSSRMRLRPLSISTMWNSRSLAGSLPGAAKVGAFSGGCRMLTYDVSGCPVPLLGNNSMNVPKSVREG